MNNTIKTENGRTITTEIWPGEVVTGKIVEIRFLERSATVTYIIRTENGAEWAVGEGQI